MLEGDLSSPLLPSRKPNSNQSPRSPHVTLTINNNLASEQLVEVNQSPSYRHQNHHQNHYFDRGQREGENPFEFLGIDDSFSVPATSTVDPFRNHTSEIEGVYEWLKIVICLPIALIRLVLFGLALAFGYLATLIALQGWKDRQNAMPRWRCRIMWITRMCARCILFSFGYHWIRRKGRPASRETAPIVVSNHVSYIEPIFFFYELSPTIVASDSHDAMPFVGTIIRAMQVIYVNRFSPASRKHAVEEIKRKAASNSFPRVLLFPEGTTANGRSLISFQLGAFLPGYPIQPVAVSYPHVHFDQSWGNISLARLMFRMFTQFHNFMEVEYLPVIPPLEKHKENAFHFAERTARAIAAASNIVQTSHSYGDVMLLMKASQSMQKNPSSYMVEMAMVQPEYNINSLEAVELLDKFLSMKPDKSGTVELSNFLRVLRLKACSVTEKIFSFIDVEKNGKITFREFLIASAYVRKQALFRRYSEVAFSRCCSEGEECISKEDFIDSIRLAIPNMNNEETNALYNMFDVDGDGRVSRDDFMSCLRKNPLLIAIFAPLLHLDSMEMNQNGWLDLEEIV